MPALILVLLIFDTRISVVEEVCLKVGLKQSIVKFSILGQQCSQFTTTQNLVITPFMFSTVSKGWIKIFWVKCFVKYWFVVMKLGTAINVQSSNSVSIIVSAGQNVTYTLYILDALIRLKVCSG